MNLELQSLAAEQTALDLGCGSASYAGCRCRIIAVDLRLPAEVPRPARGGFVQAHAARLPLPAASCDVVVANHTFEHIAEWPEALQEAARVLKPKGTLVVAVPDGYSLSDAVFRFLDKGREHVNRFRREEFVVAVERQTALRLDRWRLLCSSYAFLNRRPGQRFGGRAQPLNWIPSALLAAALLGWNALARFADRHLGTRCSVYGWLFQFTRACSGDLQVTIEDPPQPNVCIQCGASHDAAWLISKGCVRGRMLRRYRCPSCAALNLFM